MFYNFPAEHLHEAALHQPARAGQQGDRAARRRLWSSPTRPAIWLVGALLSEQNDECLVERRYLSVESMALILAEPDATDQPQAEQEMPVSPPPDSPGATDLPIHGPISAGHPSPTRDSSRRAPRSTTSTRRKPTNQPGRTTPTCLSTSSTRYTTQNDLTVIRAFATLLGIDRPSSIDRRHSQLPTFQVRR